MTDPQKTDQNERYGEFKPNDLERLVTLADHVAKEVESHGARLTVAVWDKGDHCPVAWIDCHPGDSHPQVTFYDPHRIPSVNSTEENADA